MGNSVNYEQARSTKIAQRNHQLQKYAQKFEAIISKSHITDKTIERIARADLVQIVSILNKKQATSQQLVAVLGLRSATIGRQLCIITDQNFQFALKKAKECDQIRVQSGKSNYTFDEQWSEDKHLPALFGVPVSVKDNIEMQGKPSTVGLSARSHKNSQADSPHIICMKNSGMIPFIQTNLPQLAFSFDSNNLLWGRALNPWNLNKSVGGSSGGQGAALAAGISVIGVGNDMGGSIRIPAHFCGVSGLMSSTHRLPNLNSFTKYSEAFSGKDTITAVNGPLGKSIDSLALWMSIMTSQRFYQGKNDPYVKLIPFNVNTYKIYQNPKKRVRIGFFKHLQFIECTPACARGVQQTIEYLKQQNEIVQVRIPFQREIILSMFAELLSDGDFQAFDDMLEGQQLVSQYKDTAAVTKLNFCVSGILSCIMNRSQPRVGLIINACKKLTTYQYQRVVGKIKKLRQEFINYWRQQKLDFIICPGFGIEASNHGFSNEGSLAASYVFIWNLLSMTVASTPVTVVRADEQKYDSKWDDDITKAMKKNVTDSVGLPVNIQIVGMPYQEESVLGLSKRIQDHFKFYQKHPLPINPKKK